MIDAILFDTYQAADECQLQIMNWYLANVGNAHMVRWSYVYKSKKTGKYAIPLKDNMPSKLFSENAISHINKKILIDLNDGDWRVEKQDLIKEFIINQEFEKDIIVVNYVGQQLLEQFRKKPEELQKMPSREFEELIAFLYKKQGYIVELTKKTRDGGRDIIAIKKTDVQIKLLVECKRPDVGNKVDIGIVRELYGVLTDEEATKGVIATSTFLTKDAKLFIEKHQWRLEKKDFNDINQWIQTVS